MDHKLTVTAALAALAITSSASAVGVSNTANNFYRYANLGKLYQAFTTGADAGGGFSLNSVEVEVFVTESYSVGGSVGYFAALLDDDSGVPGALITPIGAYFDTSLTGDETIIIPAQPGITLAADTTYWVQFETQGGNVVYTLTDDTSETADAGWSISDTSAGDNGDGTFTYYEPGSIAISATVIPEPSTYGVIGGLAALGVVALRRRRS